LAIGGSDFLGSTEEYSHPQVLASNLVDIVSEDLAVSSANNGRVFFNTVAGELKYVSDVAVVTVTTS
jgi:hypothetical protein